MTWLAHNRIFPFTLPPVPQRPAVSAYLLLILTNLFWAGNWVVGRAIRDDVPPIALACWRWAIALLLILPLAWPHLRRQWPLLRGHWRWMVVFGVLGTGFYNALAYIGLQHTTATNGLLLNSFIPIIIVAFSWMFLGKPLRLIEGIGVGVSLLGVLGIVARGDPSVLLGLHLNVGDLWVLASAVAWAAYTLLLPHRPAEVHQYAFLAAITVVGLIAMLPLYAWEISGGKLIHPSPVAFSAIAYTGIFPAFLGYLLWNRGVVAVGPSRAGVFMHLMTAFGILLSIVFLDERPRLYHLVGITLIFSGIFLTTRRRR
ncbi:MAG: DMT family transporter [Proteobacteria bacterium]|nr:DMT family transporter [Pseudomonadota bacterium]